MRDRPRKILVGYDGSEAAQRALDAAAGLAGYGSTLAVVSVAANGGGAGRIGGARERLLRRHVTARYLEPVGDPAEMLVETARALEADLVVVGRRRNLGSVSAEVVRNAPCDVLVVR